MVMVDELMVSRILYRCAGCGVDPRFLDKYKKVLLRVTLMKKRSLDRR